MRILSITFLLNIFFACSCLSATHSFTKLPINDEGWTDFQTLTSNGYESARVVFVSNTGNDSTGQVYGISDVNFDSYGNFIAVGTPKAYATVATAYSQIRNGYPDILLLERGSTWTAGLGGHAKSGSGITTRHIIAAYGTGNKPRLTNLQLSTYNASYLLVSSIEFYSPDWTTGARALEIVGSFDHQIFEDLYISGMKGNKLQGGTITNVVIRRCVFTGNEAYHGVIFAQQATGVLLEENVFVRNFNKNHPDGSRYGRILYFSSEQTSNPDGHDSLNGVILQGNIFANGERNGTDVRSCGTIDNNLFLQNDNNNFGGHGGSGGTIQSDCYVRNNVFAEGAPNIGGFNNMYYRNVDGGEIRGNIWTDNTGMTDYAIAIILTGDETSLYIARNITISDNIVYDYGSTTGVYALTTDSEFTDVQNVIITNNDFQMTNGSANIILNRNWDSGTKLFEGFTYSNNRYYSTASTSKWFRAGSTSGDLNWWVSQSGETGAQVKKVSYPAPTRTIKTYNAYLGGAASTSAFLDQTLLQSRTNWRTQYTADAVNDYIRAGFGISTSHQTTQTAANLLYKMVIIKQLEE